MKKIICLFIFLVVILIPKDIFAEDLIGVKGGINFASMLFNQEPYSIYKQETFMRPLFSAFFETDLEEFISFRPELMFIGRGVKINDLGVEYEFAPNYFDVRLPFLFYYKTKSVSPYLIISSNIANIVIGGQTTRWGTVDDKMNKGYINNFDFSVSFGAGLKFLINTEIPFYVGIEGQYNIGLVNNKPITNYGERYNRGIEVALTLSFPLSSSRSDNVNYPRGKDTTIIVRKDTIMITKHDTIIKTKPPVYVKDKDCYEIREIIAYMDNDFDARNKNICLYNINYDNNKASIDADSRKQLGEIIELLKKIPTMQMKIHGHADNIGKKEYNDELSEKRARGVYDYLVSKGIDKKRLSYAGYGSSHPIASNDTEQGRYQNRRVEFEITNY